MSQGLLPGLLFSREDRQRPEGEAAKTKQRGEPDLWHPKTQVLILTQPLTSWVTPSPLRALVSSSVG